MRPRFGVGIGAPGVRHGVSNSAVVRPARPGPDDRAGAGPGQPGVPLRICRCARLFEMSRQVLYYFFLLLIFLAVVFYLASRTTVFVLEAVSCKILYDKPRSNAFCVYLGLSYTVDLNILHPPSPLFPPLSSLSFSFLRDSLHTCVLCAIIPCLVSLGRPYLKTGWCNWLPTTRRLCWTFSSLSTRACIGTEQTSDR